MTDRSGTDVNYVGAILATCAFGIEVLSSVYGTKNGIIDTHTYTYIIYIYYIYVICHIVYRRGVEPLQERFGSKTCNSEAKGGVSIIYSG